MNKNIFHNDLIFGVIIIGEFLLLLTGYFNINPAESSVVSSSIRGTTYHWILLISCFPAMIAGLVICPNYQPSIIQSIFCAISIVSVQAIVYGMLGYAFSRLMNTQKISNWLMALVGIGSGYFFAFIMFDLILHRGIHSISVGMFIYMLEILLIPISSFYLIVRARKRKSI